MQPGKSNHFVSAPRCSADSKTRIALRNQASRNWMEYLVEDRVTEAAGAGVLDEGQCVPLTHDRQMSCAEQLEGCLRHRLNVFGDEGGIIVRSGAVRTGHKDHL